MERKKGNVFAAISGGVDSSVAAALLKRKGYDVTGIFIKVWQPNFLPCPWKDDWLSAMQVAAHLDIPFVTLDLSKEYKRDVVDYMIREYKTGRTPNPDVFCNKHIKFGAFLDYAKKEGADFIATGHYVRVEETDRGCTQDERGISQKLLLKGKDRNKDQSYFLWTLSQEQLKHVLFVIGEYTKPEVRALAREFGLPTAERKDSQGLCFVGKVDMREFLKHFIETEEGNVLDEEGGVVGSHEGSELYTIGQRHGFNIASKSPVATPQYVLEKDVERNTLTVSATPPSAKTSYNRTTIYLKDAHWTSKAPSKGLRYAGMYRYRQEPEPCRVVELEDRGAVVRFEREQEILPAGQSFVLYSGETCLGGGIIEYVGR